MKKILNYKAFESDEEPLYSHELRMSKGYRPRYKSGLIAVRFQDDELPFGQKYKDVDDKGEFRINYQDIFSSKKKSDFIKYFEDKYDIKLSDYRSGTDDFYIYFKCKPGTEEQKIKEIAKDKIVKVVDYVDTRGLEDGEKIQEIGEDLVDLGSELSEVSDDEIRTRIESAIEKLKSFL